MWHQDNAELQTEVNRRAGESQPNSFINPLGARSATRKLALLPPANRASASAARYPLRTAPSMVAGQPVAVQSPERKTRGHAVSGLGRYWSIPGRGEYVACTSLITVDLSSFASHASGKNSSASFTAISTISDLDLSTRLREQLTSSST